MCSGRKQSEVYAILSGEFTTKSILDSIGMDETHILYNQFH